LLEIVHGSIEARRLYLTTNVESPLLRGSCNSLHLACLRTRIAPNTDGMRHDLAELKSLGVEYFPIGRRAA